MGSSTRLAIASTWELGDYGRVAEHLAPAADVIADLAGPGEGRRAADVAAGTGSVATRLARRGWHVAACDIAPALVERGRRAATEAGLATTWHECPLGELPIEVGSLDLVTSPFGLIFAPDPASAVTEMARFLPAPPPGPTPMDWGAGRRRHPPTRRGVRRRRHADPQSPVALRPPDAATDFCFQRSSAHIATLAVAGDRADDLREAVRDHLATSSHDPRVVRIEAEYLVVVATA